MKPLIQFKTTTPLLLIPLLLACFALLPRAQAVVPAPDGGYPGNNTAEGTNALFSLTTGINNTAVGANALLKTTDGGYNAAFGSRALENNIHGAFNMAVGTQALFNNTADANMAVGFRVLFNNTIGNNLTGIGTGALFKNTTGNNNTGIGSGALNQNTAGASNTAIGRQALLSNTLGSNNVAVGWRAGDNVATASGVVCIGSGVAGANVPDTTYIRNINTTTVSGAGTDFVTVNLTTGLLGHVASKRRYKEDIKPMDNASEALYRLKPVTYRFKKEINPTPNLEYGLIAEDVANVDPNLAIRDGKGQIESVRYMAVNAMLLNEFLKEHRKVQGLEAAVAQQQRNFQAAIAQQQTDFQSKLARQEREIKALTASLKEQAWQIKKVSAQLKLDKTRPQIVLNDQ